MKAKSHLREQRALSRTALICRSCPWRWLWQQGSWELGKWTISLERMLMYSEGGVMAIKAFDAITLTLYIGLADSWSRGGRKEDNVLAGAHERRFNFWHHNAQINTDNCTHTFVMRKKKNIFTLLCLARQAGAELRVWGQGRVRVEGATWPY